jgi:hypothetical protein
VEALDVYSAYMSPIRLHPLHTLQTATRVRTAYEACMMYVTKPAPAVVAARTAAAAATYVHTTLLLLMTYYHHHLYY